MTTLMSRLGAATLALLLLLAGGPGAIAQDRDAAFDALLSRYVTAAPDGINRVDYGRWHATAADRKALDAYIGTLTGLAPSQMPKPEAFAYWVNLYNAVTLKVVLDAYPLKSIKDVKSDKWIDPKSWLGPWRTERVTVEGRALSLDAIEHDILRPTYRDPRVHYAVNCASIGCPNLMPRAWRAATLEADLEAAARAYINHPRGARVTTGGTLAVSSIYRWFISDFGGDDAGVIRHLRQYAAPALAQPLARATRIGEDGYDWTLNDARRSGRGS